MGTNLLAREQRVACAFPSGRDIMLSRVAGFSAHDRSQETLLINYMTVFTQHGFLTFSSKPLFSQSCISFIYLLFILPLFLKRIWDSWEKKMCGDVCEKRLSEMGHLEREFWQKCRAYFSSPGSCSWCNFLFYVIITSQELLSALYWVDAGSFFDLYLLTIPSLWAFHCHESRI